MLVNLWSIAADNFNDAVVTKMWLDFVFWWSYLTILAQKY